MHCIVFVLVSLCLTSVTWGQNSQRTQSDLLNDLRRNYDRRIRPEPQGGTFNVSVSVLVLDVFNVNEANHEFSVTMYWRQHWLDKRLQYTKLPDMNYIVVGTEFAKTVWTPDTFILNERNSIKHDFGTTQEYMKIYPDGRVLHSTRVTVTASCKMSLGYFPFDRQICGLEFASYSQLGSDYSLGWSAGGASAAVSEDLSSSSLNYKFDGIKILAKTLVYPSGKQMRLGLAFYFARHSMRFVQDVFLPTLIFTLVALGTLFCASVTLRIQLSALVTIAMVVFMSICSSWMPRVSYQTALDLYMTASAITIFMTLVANFLQYKFHGVGSNRQALSLRDLNSIEKSEQLVDYERSNGLHEPLCEPEVRSGLGLGSKVDELLKSACALFTKYLPISYVCFNVIFWLVVLIGSCWYPTGFLAMEETEA